MINRRSFIKLLINNAVLFFSSFTLAKNTNLLNKKSILLNKCSVAGFQYYQGREVIELLQEKETLILLPEPDNQYDKYAVAIFYQDKKLGYLPRSDNKHISRMLLAGIPLLCQVLATDPKKQAWYAVIVGVYIQV
jgi:hypothetical protein